MRSEIKVYKIDLKDATREVQMLICSTTIEGGEIKSLKTEIWNDYLIVSISILYKD